MRRLDGADEAWVRLGEMSAFRSAFDAPGARLAHALAERRFPSLSVALGLLLAFPALLRLACAAGLLDAPLPLDLDAAFPEPLLLGASALLLDGRWWCPLTAPLLHANLVHLLCNLPVVLYCGFRVERALGAGSLALILASSLLGSTLAVVMGSDAAVLGASTLASGLWGAQIAIGFRFAELLPRRERRFYGWGNFVFFAPIFAAGFVNPSVSQAGHLGGLLGGVLAAMLPWPETCAPASLASSRRRLNTLVAGGLILVMVSLAPLGARFPSLLLGARASVRVDSLGVELEMPRRMARRDLAFLGRKAWIPTLGDEQPFFAGLEFLQELPVESTPPHLAAAWEALLGVCLEALPAPEPLSPEWSVAAFAFTDAEGRAWHLSLHTLRRGRYLLELGHLLRDEGRSRGRERLYDGIARSVRVSEPPSLAEARRRFEAAPNAARRRVEFAEKLGFAGKAGEADALLVGVSDPAWAWTVAEHRLWLASEHPGETELDATEMARWILSQAPDEAPSALLRALAYLERDGACEALAEFRHRRLPGLRARWAGRPALVEAFVSAGAACPSGS
jgi:membrane associated rhomboid family serine protease